LQKYTTDSNGYLTDLNDWHETVAIEIAQQDHLILHTDHWHIIYYLRNFYLEFNNVPTVRMLVKELAKKIGTEQANSIYLHQLFPQGVIKQACKIAGLPKPARCI
jgi:tRNA 2-thiouridine synthesizing protein E